MHTYMMRSWCNRNHRKKWTWRPEFKSWCEAIRISHSANTLGKDMNQAILPLAIGKIKGQRGIFSFVTATGQKE